MFAEPVSRYTDYHTDMARKTTINIDDEMQAALDELMQTDGTATLAIKRALIAEAARRRSTTALLDFITEWEAENGPIDATHVEWADGVLDRQGAQR